MKAIQIHTWLIHCDTCGHEFHGEIEEWLGKPCPKCDAPNIINQKDVAYMKMIVSIADLGNELLGDIPEDSEMANVKFSSAGLR